MVYAVLGGSCRWVGIHPGSVWRAQVRVGSGRREVKVGEQGCIQILGTQKNGQPCTGFPLEGVPRRVLVVNGYSPFLRKTKPGYSWVFSVILSGYSGTCPTAGCTREM